MAAVAALSLCACGRNGSLELPPGPAGIQQNWWHAPTK